MSRRISIYINGVKLNFIESQIIEDSLKNYLADLQEFSTKNIHITNVQHLYIKNIRKLLELFTITKKDYHV